ncbi:MAG: adenosylmethionine--8-amino-7-oxononanoate transaminase [Deltaproteobacteria bacterium]|nr:adenosylmethionine--8-amino-7-oxononanoate transaminase [Deltaproteobacteria bacterium]
MANTRELLEADFRHLWHPFTQHKLWAGEPPLVIARGEGNWLIDTEGKRYFDGVSSLWVTVHGHGHPAINQAIADQLTRLDHSTMLGLTHAPAIRLAERLTGLAPTGLTRAFYSESGSTAVEIALKIAYQYCQLRGWKEKKTFVALENAYHGDTIGAVSVGGIELFHEVYRPLLFPVHRLPQPHCRNCRLGLTFPACDLACANKLDEMLSEHGAGICGLVVEPRVQGAAGIVVQPEGYLKRLYDICRDHEVLFIADEVATGFGRTGAMFACELEDTPPDLMAVGKGLTGGVLPLSATLASEEIFQAFWGEFDEFRHFFHGHTYTGNPLAAAAALASLDLMAENQVLANVQARAEQMAQGLAPLAGRPHVAEIRQQGLMGGIEIMADPAKNKAYAPGARMGHQVIMAARPRGVIVRPLGDTIVLMPPLSSSEEEIDLLVDAVSQAVIAVTEGA